MWQRRKIGDLINLKRGYDLPSSDRINGDIPIISSSGITDFHNEFKKCGEGVVTGRYGTLGEVFYINGKYWPLNTTLYVTDFKGNYPKFIYYFLKTLKLERFNGAAAVPGLDRNVIHKVEVLFPNDFSTQQKIASILSAYDELIENNKQRIKLLEEMAEEIYKEWFVRLRFPNYENTEFVDGLPKGWENSKIKDFGKVITGKTPSTVIAEYYGGEIPFIKTPDMHGKIFLLSTEETITELGKNSQKSQTIPENSICVNCIGALSGSVSITTEISQTNQQIHSIILNTLRDREFLFFLLRGLKPYILQLGNTGATMTNVSKGKFENIDVIKPSDDVIENFSKITFSIFEEIKVLSQKNQLLQQTRDLLLPRLISGKLSVEGLAEAKEYIIGQNAEPWPVAAEAEGDYHHS